ncbi:MAG: hypothetical protein EOO01_01615 [Chitinophagaceae bacterium]|nr:MAG: hypothetical protein EOO01_01615 [Chitinophagaceae bacterium]
MDTTAITRHIEQNNFVKISRSLPGCTEDLRGFILAKSASFLLVQETYDFMFNGYSIMRRADISSIRNGKFEKTSKRIFKGEGLLASSLGLDVKINLKSWQTIFTDLKKLDYHAIIKCEDKEEADFIIGPIKRISNSLVSLQYYDPKGKLKAKPDHISFPDITTVTFGDNYSTIFREYLVAPEKKA